MRRGNHDDRVEAFRARAGEPANHLVDELRAGRISRREFVRRGSVLGLSIPLLGVIAAACGSGDKDPEPGSNASGARVEPGGTFLAGIAAPAGAVDPLTVVDEGGIGLLGQTGEYLTWSDRTLTLRPRLATRWRGNADSTEWTFEVRPNVRFHDGSPLTARDVASTFKRLADPAVGSAALSAFRGVLSPAGVSAPDDRTVVFALEAPNGNFPYLVSSDNYNTIVLPRGYDGDWERTFIGTGPFKLDRFRPGDGATFVRNPDYWGPKANPDRTDLRFYAREQARVLALQSGDVQAITSFSVSGAKALLTDPDIQVRSMPSSAHRLIHMRTDRPPFDDVRIRQAVALLIDREGLVESLFEGRATIGNDSPFAPVFKSTAKDVPQRRRDVARAKALLSEAGLGGGFTVRLDTWDGLEIPDLAQLLQSNVEEAGINIELNITDVSTYYGDSISGSSPWLDSVMGITDYGHRSVPNVFLGAPLLSDGTWNSAHFANREYDRLVAEYVAAVDIDAQQRYARRIQELLLEETPVAIPYFHDYLTSLRAGVAGVESTAIGHLQLARAGVAA